VLALRVFLPGLTNPYGSIGNGGRALLHFCFLPAGVNRDNTGKCRIFLPSCFQSMDPPVLISGERTRAIRIVLVRPGFGMALLEKPEKTVFEFASTSSAGSLIPGFTGGPGRQAGSVLSGCSSRLVFRIPRLGPGSSFAVLSPRPARFLLTAGIPAPAVSNACEKRLVYWLSEEGGENGMSATGDPVR
jgi:hypothetical protein